LAPAAVAVACEERRLRHLEAHGSAETASREQLVHHIRIREADLRTLLLS
jgi:hypothetical protein